jgi:hypothetical protein
MQLKYCFILFCFISFLGEFRSQDILYLNNGSKFEAIVKEITPTEVKYKNFNNPDGPTYVITKGDVLLVEYKNGTVEVLNKNPITVAPQKNEPEPQKIEKKKTSPADLNYVNKNSIMINGIALANADITFLYDRELLNGHLSVTALGGYNFNPKMTWPNLFIQQLTAAKKIMILV